MSSLPSLVRPDGTPKSFWERPEGWTGIISMGAIGLGAFFLLKEALPTILTVLTGLIAAVGKGIVLVAGGALLFALIMLVTNKQVHALIGTVFKLVMRKITGLIVEIDPIGIMKLYVDDLRKRLGEMDARLGALTGAITKIKKIIQTNAAKHEDAMRLASAAHNAGKVAYFTLQSKRAGRAEQSNVRYEDVLKKMEYLKVMLMKYREASEVMIADITDEVETQEVEREAMLAAYGAMTKVRDILTGAGDKKALFDQALEFSVNDYCAKIGEIDQFMLTSQSFVDGLDLENGSFSEEAMAKIQAWEEKADSLLLGTANQQIQQKLGAAPIAVGDSGSSYSKLLGQK